MNEEIKVIFTEIDAVRLREIKWTGTLILGIIGIIFAGITFGLLFVYTDLHLGWICFIAIAMMAVTAVVLYFQFAHLALKRGKLDGLEMAKLYTDIKEKRSHLSNLQKTYNRLIQLKMARTVEERNNNFLRKVNLLRLESLRVFQDRNIKLRNTEARLQEIAFLSAETLARIHTELLTPERYTKIRKTQQGQIYAMHLVFSDYICVHLFGTLLLTLEGKSSWGS